VSLHSALAITLRVIDAQVILPAHGQLGRVFCFPGFWRGVNEVAQSAFVSHFFCMSATYESVMSAALQLGLGDRCRLASDLWESTRPAQGEENEELEELLNQREADLDQDASAEMSHEDFMDYFAARLAK